MGQTDKTDLDHTATSQRLRLDRLTVSIRSVVSRSGLASEHFDPSQNQHLVENAALTGMLSKIYAVTGVFDDRTH
jgi:hypothetical protein